MMASSAKRRPRAAPRIAALAGMAPLALGLAACAPRFQHLDGSAFHPIAPPLAFDHGWMVLDSCAVGPHALVEIEVAVDHHDPRPPQPERVALRLAAGDRWPRARTRVDGPFCVPSRDQDPRTILPHEQGTRRSHRMQQPCAYVVRAQFALERLPPLATSMTLVHGIRVIHLSRR